MLNSILNLGLVINKLAQFFFKIKQFVKIGVTGLLTVHYPVSICNAQVLLFFVSHTNEPSWSKSRGFGGLRRWWVVWLDFARLIQLSFKY